ncbi:MAG: lamin tail domain-containing protein, partial [Bifidobacteriaceae bacterium]|nr:lamin tail domain-containing protein [Bifidobacteriaceae bacterium]
MIKQRSRLMAALATCGLAGTVLVGTAVAQAAVDPNSAVVINEVYGGGGNNNAVYTNDFVELYNKSSAAVPLAGWSLQYASSTGTSFSAANTLALSGTIPANDYFLIKLAAGSNNILDLPTADLESSTPLLSGTAGKVALVSTTAALGSCPDAGTSCSLKADVIDFVGWGGANDYAGTAPAGATTNPTSISRNGSHANTPDNAADFTVGAPSPVASAEAGAPPPPPPLTEPKTIAQIQGTGAASPLV